MNKLKRCKRCLYPETKPNLYFDRSGICSACLNHERKKNINWESLQKQFYSFVEKAKHSKLNPIWDCVVPVSGGKDSTFQILFLKELGLNPLGICFEPSVPTEIGKKNLKNLSDQGVDVILFQKNNIVYKKLVKIGFEELGDEMWINHIGIFTLPIRLALNLKIPLVVWGENPEFEYGGNSKNINLFSSIDEAWIKKYGGGKNTTVLDLCQKVGLSNKEVSPYIFPQKDDFTFELNSIFLGSFFDWNMYDQLKFAEKRGFSYYKNIRPESCYHPFEGLDDGIGGVHEFLKFLKFGYSRVTDQVSRDIRNSKISIDRGIQIINEYEGIYPKKGVDLLSQLLDLSIEKIDETFIKFSNKELFEIIALKGLNQRSKIVSPKFN